MPSNVDALKSFAGGWVDEHSKEIQHAEKNSCISSSASLVGMVIGALISLHEDGPAISQTRPFAAALSARVSRFARAFRQIIFAQVKISAINTVFTAIILAGSLPAFGIHLPLSKTLIAVTFLAGLLPVIGNLISNSLILVAGLSISVSQDLLLRRSTMRTSRANFRTQA